jgi:hypothetical protein
MIIEILPVVYHKARAQGLIATSSPEEWSSRSFFVSFVFGVFSEDSGSTWLIRRVDAQARRGRRGQISD